MAPEGRDPDTRAQLRREARLLLGWARGAGGRWLPAESPGEAPGAAVPANVTVGATALEGAPEAVPALDPAERSAVLAAMAKEVAGCTRCVLAATRTCTVFGEGSPTARLVIVGEAPGAEEDRTGRPFVGAAGGLLTKMLAAIGLPREEVYICNLLKCRPPGNRTPRPDEVGACKPFLREQLRTLAPEVILALGSPAARELLRTRRGITSLRGRFMRTHEGHRVMPTFHPAYLLRNPAAKRDVWNDLQQVAAALDLEIPSPHRK